jgi:hypothetical protein
VQGRTGILFHPGTTEENTRGCIILGQYWEKLGSDRIMKNSGDTFRRFMEAMEGYDKFKLSIVECF